MEVSVIEMFNSLFDGQINAEVGQIEIIGLNHLLSIGYFFSIDFHELSLDDNAGSLRIRFIEDVFGGHAIVVSLLTFVKL